METFSALLAIVRGIHRSPMNSPHKGQWRGASMFSLICAWINRVVNNREAGDLRRYRAHYDVIVMIIHSSDSFKGRVPVDGIQIVSFDDLSRTGYQNISHNMGTEL